MEPLIGTLNAFENMFSDEKVLYRTIICANNWNYGRTSACCACCITIRGVKDPILRLLVFHFALTVMARPQDPHRRGH